MAIIIVVEVRYYINIHTICNIYPPTPHSPAPSPAVSVPLLSVCPVLQVRGKTKTSLSPNY